MVKLMGRHFIISTKNLTCSIKSHFPDTVKEIIDSLLLDLI